MKKLLALVFCFVLVFALSGCASYRTYEQIAADGKLVVATNATFPPYEFIDDDGNYAGIDIEIIEAVGEYLGLEVEIQNIEFDAILTAVPSGKADVGIAGMTVDETRLKSVDFSDTYATGKQVIITSADSGIAGVDDLAGKKVGVQTGTTGDIYASDDMGDDRVVRFNSGADAVMALKNGKVDCVIIDNEPAKAYVESTTGLKLLDTKYAEEEYAICVSKNNVELLGKVSAALQDLIADGTVQAIVDKYITAE